MILFFVLVGFLAGTVAAVLALAAGWGIMAAILAYSLFGALAVMMAAVIVAVAPLWRPKAEHGIPVKVPVTPRR